ncbi:MAG: flagellar hook protein FlgE [Chloroflexi bacterium]|nr:flagellar hook protein FlgE [Chloroflexota bacterium]
MLRSMFTAISALNLHQDYLDVISDNLANANTTGFKSSRVVFQDLLSEIISPGAAPAGSKGGVNPTQIGLGAQMGYIAPVFTQGMSQSTGRNLDCAIQGEGFFIFDQGLDRRYSRDGSFTVDASGYLVSSSTGLRAQGWQNPNPGATTLDTNAGIGEIIIPLDNTIARETANITLGGNLNSETALAGVVNTSFTVFDSMGVTHNPAVRFTRTGDNTWSWAATSPTGVTGSGTVTFDSTGHVTGTNPATSTITFDGSDGAEQVNFDVDMSGITMLANSNSVASTYQDGLAAGTVSDVYIAQNTGQIYAVYSNGLKELVGQVALASFTNPSGLIRDGSNYFMIGLNSGEPAISAADTAGKGKIMTSSLEASNVDMAQEFTNMILAQRGFQASSRVISTSDEILQELVNLKR